MPRPRRPGGRPRAGAAAPTLEALAAGRAAGRAGRRSPRLARASTRAIALEAALVAGLPDGAARARRARHRSATAATILASHAQHRALLLRAAGREPVRSRPSAAPGQLPSTARTLNRRKREAVMPVSIGPMELIIVLVIALIVLGPKRLPEVGRSLGTGCASSRTRISGITPRRRRRRRQAACDRATAETRRVAASAMRIPRSSARRDRRARAGRRAERVLRHDRRARRRGASPCTARATPPRARCATRSTAMEQYRIQTAIEDAGLELGAIYHSHTRSAPYPSQTDINLAFYPERAVRDRRRRGRRSRTCGRGGSSTAQVTEAALEVEDGAALMPRRARVPVVRRRHGRRRALLPRLRRCRSCTAGAPRPRAAERGAASARARSSRSTPRARSCASRRRATRPRPS